MGRKTRVFICGPKILMTVMFVVHKVLLTTSSIFLTLLLIICFKPKKI